MAPASQTTSNLLDSSSQSKVSEPQNLLFKLYANLLANNYIVKSGLNQITRISKPIMGRIEDRVVKTTGKVTRWVTDKNIYNELTNLWLSKQYPFCSTIIPFDTFAKELGNQSKDLRGPELYPLITNYYNSMTTGWVALNEPSVNDIKNTILESVAKAINRSYHLDDDTLSYALFNMMRQIIEKRKELVSQDFFLGLVKKSVGESFNLYHSQAIEAATKEYYTFAKRFVMIDFPLVTNHKDIVRLIINFVHDSSFYYGDSTLTFIERNLDGLLSVLGARIEETLDDNNLTERAQRILRKVFLLSTYPVNRVQHVFHQVQNTQTYAKIDNLLHINDGINLTHWGFNKVKENVLEPSLNSIRIITNKTRQEVTVVMHGLDVDVLKGKYRVLHAKYEILQKCVVMIADETVKLIFDKQALHELGENGKKEMLRLYKEVKSMESRRITNLGLEYYQKLIGKVADTYNTASRAIYYKKRELGDNFAASAVRPKNDLGAEAYDQAHGEVTTLG